jgi:hypothetical protein
MARVEEIRKAQRENTAIVEDHPLSSSRNSSNDRLVSEIEENFKKIIHSLRQVTYSHISSSAVRPFFARSAPPLGDGMRKKDTEIPPKRASV